MNLNDFLCELSKQDISELESLVNAITLSPGEVVFSEGDEAEHLYIIRKGKVSVSIEKCGRSYVLRELDNGGIFGELALLNDDVRSTTATALVETTLLSINNDVFKMLINSNHGLSERIQKLLTERNEELLLKEQLATTTGVSKDNLNISIKGDPSLRETVFTRQRYENVVDSVLPKLVPALHKIIFDTSVYRVFVGLNNGEVRVCSVISPFIEEVHMASKLISPAYIERHFPPMEYETKVRLVHETTTFIESTKTFADLPSHWNRVLDTIQDEWQPVPREELENVLKKLLELRKIPNFYLRNFSLSIVQDAIRMQFNCDGTHIVSTNEYEKFLEKNIEFK